MFVDNVKVYMKSMIACESQHLPYSPLEAELMTETSNIVLGISHDKNIIH